VRYFSLLIAETTTTKGHYQGLFKEKERERDNKNFERKKEMGKLL